MLSGNIKKLINNDAILNSHVLFSREQEKERIQNMLKRMKEHADKIADFNEEKNYKHRGQLTNYCQYIHV